MANTIKVSGSVATTVNATKIEAAQVGALLRTALAKGSSCKTIKGSATADSRLVDTLRGNKYAVKSLVLVSGGVTVDVNGQLNQRLDRIKLFAQAASHLIRSEKPLDLISLVAEMDRLCILYASNVDIKQPDAETFDGIISDMLGQDAIDRFKQPIRVVAKSGDFSVADMEMQILGSSVCVEGQDFATIASIDAPSVVTLALAKRLLAGSKPVIVATSAKIVGGDTIPSTAKRSSR